MAAAPEPQDKVQTLKEQVDGVKNIMTQNVDRILARGERLDDLMDKSEDLQAGVSLTTGAYSFTVIYVTVGSFFFGCTMYLQIRRLVS